MSGTPHLILAATFLVAACSNTTATVVGDPETGPVLVGPPPTLTIDQISYVAVPYPPATVEKVWRFTVIATLRNNSDQALYVDAKGPTPTYVVYPDTGTSAYNMASALIPGTGLRLAPNSSRIDTLSVQGPNSFDGHTHVGFGVLTGSMTISYAVGTCVQVDLCEQAEQVSSPAFTVTVAP